MRPSRAALVALRGLVLVGLLGLSGAAGCTDGGARGHSRLGDDQKRRNVESFDYVWQTIRTRHWDPNLNGVDWQAVRDELRPKAEAAESQAAARDAIQDMLARLGQSHFAILPAEVYEDVEARPDPEADGRQAGDGRSGLDVRMIDGRAVVWRVEPNSPASEAGIRPGWIVARVGERDLAPALAKLAEKYPGSPYLEFYQHRAVMARLQGRVGRKVSLDLLNERDEPVSLRLTLGQPVGVPAQFGNLPTHYVRFDSQRLEQGVGYIAFNIFLDPQYLMREYEKALRSFADAPGVIIDLRGNPGGLGAMAMGMAGCLTREPNQRLGTMTTREATLTFVALPRPSAYTGPVAVLVDGLSMSTSEIFAGGLRDLGRARVFGARTPGAALPSVIERLPNGDGFQYAFANFVSADGRLLEGRGVTPDVAIAPTRAGLLAGDDAVIDAARVWIVEQSQR